jgi:hypothetical protein
MTVHTVGAEAMAKHAPCPVCSVDMRGCTTKESQSGLSRTIDGSYLPLPALKVPFELSIAGGQFGLSTAGNWEPSG